ncbi:TetR/AcrR family transcriptional regulator [Chitinophaga defluvii]|uniref:TetR/AcrR family transcriptional regulator n=1 Tax=Chitinophaga defluvii TaxID=3163343 RepID=A0ABV2T004_9BACT
MNAEKNTEEQIIEAAKKIFTKKGLAGARMQDIADEAGINKAMLHYYYRSKDKLFEIVFNEAINKVMTNLNTILAAKMPFPEKIKAIIENYITALTANPQLPLFVLHEITQNPEMFIRELKARVGFPNVAAFMREIVEEGEKGTIRKISPVQLVMNILSMSVFPFVAKPLFQAVAEIDDVQFRMIMEDRKRVLVEFILAALRP